MSIDDLSVTARLAGPSITVSPATLTAFSATPSTPSATQTFNVSGSALTNDITITPPANYEISTADGVGFTATNPITLPQSGGTIATTPIYVRLKSGALGAYNNETINITSSGATAKTVTVSGDVVRKTITSTTSGDWNTGATWVGGIAPTSGDNVVIATGHTVSVATAITRDTGATTTVNGFFQLNNGGYAGGEKFTYAATGSGLIFNNTGVGAYGVGAGNAFWPTINPPFNVTINNGASGGARINTPVGKVNGTLTLNAQLDAVNAISVDGTLQLNGGGYVSSNAPVYGAASTLLYNTNYGVGLEWTGNGTTAGSGTPQNVTVQNNAAVTYGAVGARGLTGILTITSGSLTAGDILNVKGTTSNAGTLTTNSTANFTGTVTNTRTFNSKGISNLSANFTNSGATSVLNLNNDFKLAGNWSNAGTFNPNNKAVFFNGATGGQSITNTNSGTETFAYLVNDKAAGTLTISSNIIISGTAGDVLQLINSGSTSLAGSRSITFTGNGGNILVSGAQRTIVGSGSNALININGTKTVRSLSGGSLVLGANITTKLANGMNFGAGLTTISHILEINANGFVNTNAPIYGSVSTLTYNTGAAYGVSNEWTGNSTTAGAGVPQNVVITGNTIVNMPNSIRGLAGNLTINALSSLNMNNTIGADLALGGNFTNSGTFTPNNTAVIFNGEDTTQTITGATTFDYFVVNKTGTLGSVTLASSIIVNKDLTLTNKCIVTGANNLTLPNKTSTITSNANSYVNTTSTGKLVRLGIDGTSDWVFPVGVNALVRYTPITLKNLSGTTDIQVSASTTITKAAAVPANALLAEWRVTSSSAVTANVRTDWTSTENNSVNTSGPGDLGVYNSTVGSNYTLYDVTLSTYNTEATNVSLVNTGVNSILVSNDDAIMIGNDECIGAKTITVNATAISGSTVGASSSLSAITCNSKTSGTSRDVWYKFTTGAAGFYKIEVVRGTLSDPVIDLRSGACNGTNIACADTNNATESITIELSAGTEYSYRVYNNGNSLGDGTFTTSVTTVPTITVNPTSLAFGDVSVTTDSAVKTFTAKASLLTSATGNIDIASPTSYQLSLDGSTGWASTLSFPYIGSTLAETTIYAKLTPDVCGDYNGNITVSGGGATTANVAVTGKGVISAPTANAATDITGTTFTANWDAVAGAIGYELDVYEIIDAGLVNKFTENFNGFTAGQPNASANGTNIATTINTYTQSTGWSGVQVYQAGGTVKLGGGSSLGSITTPIIDISADTGNFTLEFQAMAWNGDSKNLKIFLNNNLVHTISNDLNNTSTYTLKSYSIPLTGGTSTSLIRFEGNTNSSSRFFLENLVIKQNSKTKAYILQNENVGNVISYNVTGLTPNTQYYYVVRAITATCESINSGEIDVKTSNNVVWDAGAWSNTSGPSATLNAIVRSPFVVGADATQVSFTAKDLTVESTGSLEIPANQNITVTGNITTADNKIIVDSDGSLLQTNNPSSNENVGQIIAKRGTHMRKMDYTYWSTPVTGQKLLNTSGGANATLYNVGGFSEGTPNNRIYQYNEPNDTFKAATDANFIPAKAYAIRGKDKYLVEDPSNNPRPDTFNFTGVPNNGSYTVGIQKSKNTPSGNPAEPYTHGYNMIGNPYPSNIDFIKFYNYDHGDGNKNSDHILGKAWFWTNVPGAPTSQGGSAYSPNNYAILSLAGGTPATGVDTDKTESPTSDIPNEFIKVAQGFIVEMKGTAPTVATPNTAILKFDNSIRTNNSTGHFYNSKNSQNAINRYWLKLTSPFNIVNTILVAHMDGATNNYDADYDADLLSIGDDSFYSKLNTQKLQIQARNNPLNLEDIIPLGTKYSTTGTYKISLGKSEGLFSSNQQIYLIDKINNTYTDLTAQDYTFTANKGIDDARFEIVYKNKEVLGTDALAKSDFVVYKDGNYFVVKSSKNLGRVELYDISGRLVQSNKTSDKEIRLDANVLPSGVYIVKAENSGITRTKKIIK